MDTQDLDRLRSELAARISIAKLKIRELRRLRVQPDGTDFTIAERRLEEDLSVCQLELERLGDDHGH